MPKLGSSIAHCGGDGTPNWSVSTEYKARKIRLQIGASESYGLTVQDARALAAHLRSMADDVEMFTKPGGGQ